MTRIRLTITQFAAPELIPAETLIRAAVDGLRQLGLDDHCEAVNRSMRELAPAAQRIHYLQRLSEAASVAGTVSEARGDVEAQRIADAAFTYVSIAVVKMGERGRKMAS